MLDLAKLQAVTTVVCHNNCPDGLASALLVRDALPNATTFLFVQHNTPEHKALVPQPNMMFVDFVPYAETEEYFVGPKLDRKSRRLTTTGRAQVQAWVEAGTFVLDHHKTVKDLGIIQPFMEAGLGVFGDELENPGVCGAVLAYEHVWKPFEGKGSHIPEGKREWISNFARLAGIRDTWQKQSPDFREASLQAEVLMFYPQEHWFSISLMRFAMDWKSTYRPVGEILMERQENAVVKIAENAYRFTTASGTRVAMFDSVKKSSDVSERLGDTADLVIGFGYVSDAMVTVDPLTIPGIVSGTLSLDRTAKLIVSTRSATKYNCVGLASFYGGGGHSQAAGFNRTLSSSDPQPFEMIRQLVEAFEAQPRTFR